MIFSNNGKLLRTIAFFLKDLWEVGVTVPIFKNQKSAKISRIWLEIND